MTATLPRSLAIGSLLLLRSNYARPLVSSNAALSPSSDLASSASNSSASATTGTSAPSSSSPATSQDRTSPTLTIIISVVVPLLITILAITIFVSFRRKLRGRNVRRSNDQSATTRSSSSASPTSASSSSNRDARSSDLSPPASDETLMGHVGRWIARQFAVPTSSVGTDSVSNAGQGSDSNDSAQRSGRRQNRRRGRGRNAIQRSDSGRSVKTLPEYKTSLGENELMLYKAHVMPLQGDDEGMGPHEGEYDTPDMVEREVRRSLRQSSRRSGAGVTVVTQTEDGEIDVERQELVNTNDDEPQEGQDSIVELNNVAHRASLTSFAVNGVSALRRSLRRHTNRTTSGDSSSAFAEDSTRRGPTEEERGDEMNDLRLREERPPSVVPTDATPTYDSIYPMLTIDSSEQDPASSISVQSNVGRQIPGANTLRSIFRRQPAMSTPSSPAAFQRFTSTASVLSSAATTSGQASVGPEYNALALSPTRGSDASVSFLGTPSHHGTSRRLFSPFHTFANASNASLLSGTSIDSTRNRSSGERTRRSSNAAATLPKPSTHQRNISAPLSIRRLQFEPPAAGFTDQQMAFLASVESLDKYGIAMQYGMATAGEGHAATMASTSNHNDFLPSFEQLARQQEDQLRMLSAQSARPAPTITAGEVHSRQDREGARLADPLSSNDTSSAQMETLTSPMETTANESGESQDRPTQTDIEGTVDQNATQTDARSA